MEGSRQQTWIGATLLAGAAYFLIGRLFALPSTHAQAWRLAAWGFSGAAFAAHIGYEHFRLRHPTRVMAGHVALAVALGAIALAVAGAIHSLSNAAAKPLSWLLALVIWPAVTAIPAFLVALAAGTLLARVPSRPGNSLLP